MSTTDRQRRRRAEWRARRARAARIEHNDRHTARELQRWSHWIARLEAEREADVAADLSVARDLQRAFGARDWVAYRSRGMRGSEPATVERWVWIISSGLVAEVDDVVDGRVIWRLLSTWERFDERE